MGEGGGVCAQAHSEDRSGCCLRVGVISSRKGVSDEQPALIAHPLGPKPTVVFNTDEIHTLIILDNQTGHKRRSSYT